MDPLQVLSLTVHIPSRYGIPTHKVFDVRFISKGESLSNEGSTQPHTVVAVDKSAEPLYHHRSHHRLPTCPDRPHEENQMISRYWEINGTRAHCVLDSGSEGIMISPDFTHTMGMKTFMLAQPIALQLACIGSCSTINYDAKTTIRFGDQDIDEHFNVTNVEYYNVILGISFLKQLGICLDFRDPAHILIGNKEVPTNKELALEVPKLERKRNQPMKLVDETVNE